MPSYHIRSRPLVVNCVSLALALISNVALSLNMARRLSFAIAQPTTVDGRYLPRFSSAVFPQTVNMHGYHHTQGSYYGIIAAAMYFAIPSLMMITIYAVRTDHFLKEFDLACGQGAMMLQTILYICYLLLGALVYSYVEDWSYLNALYWANFTIMTTGIGDLSPKTKAGRGLIFPFAVGCVLSHHRVYPVNDVGLRETETDSEDNSENPQKRGRQYQSRQRLSLLARVTVYSTSRPGCLGK